MNNYSFTSNKVAPLMSRILIILFPGAVFILYNNYKCLKFKIRNYKANGYFYDPPHKNDEYKFINIF